MISVRSLCKRHGTRDVLVDVSAEVAQLGGPDVGVPTLVAGDPLERGGAPWVLLDRRQRLIQDDRVAFQLQVVEALLELTADIARPDDVPVGIPGDLTRDIHGAAERRRYHSHLRKAVLPAVEQTGGHDQRSAFHRGTGPSMRSIDRSRS